MTIQQDDRTGLVSVTRDINAIDRTDLESVALAINTISCSITKYLKTPISADDVKNDPVKYLDYSCFWNCGWYDTVESINLKYLQQDLIRQYARELLK